STGATMAANGLVEVERIAEVSSRLVVNRAALKTRTEEVNSLIDAVGVAVKGAANGAANGN
ncbi:MAG: ATP phosphoribosyltransferase, partial [Rhodospirillales bacterium]|nr:ATP phosphoribosyltransferase [Rhodospirillales bacterium]